MASLLTHPAVPLAIGVALGTRIISPRLLGAGIVGCLLPDADVIAYALGVPYQSAFAHRGFTHSIFFALICGVLAAMFAPTLHARRAIAFAFVAVATASHGLLDAFTTGGSGIACFWPFADQRYFMPLQIILVSPIGVSRFFSEWGVRVLVSELKWVWLPTTAFATVLFGLRRIYEKRSEHVSDTTK
jgi:inner membrane protein